MAADRPRDPDGQIDRIAEEFEAAWRDGAAPDVQQFLARAPADLQRALLEELVRIDISVRRVRGKLKPLEQYLAEFPELADGQGSIRAELRTFYEAEDAPRDHTLTVAPTPTPDDIVLPEHVGNYRIVRRLGAGSFGVVLLAEQRRPRRYVALKLLRTGMAPRELQRFEQEAEALGRLEHEGIAHVYEADIDESGTFPQPFLAMEYVDGLTLNGYVRGKALDRRGIIKLMITVSRAVQYAHQRGIIHRDLKPGNILVTRDGQPKLLDFGLAKFARADSMSPAASLTGEVLGTPEYMAPEQARGEAERIDTRTDIYSLGAILYYLLLDHHAHAMEGSTYHRVQRVATEEPRRPRAIDPRIDRDLEALLLKALAPEPEQRYSSAAELAADLQRYLDGEPLIARPQTTLYFLRKRLWRHRRIVMSAFAALVFLAVASVFYVYTLQVQRQEARTARAKAEREQQRAETSLLNANDQRAVALQTLNDLVFSAQRELRAAPGALALRRKLLDIALTGLDRIAQIAGDAQLSPDRTTAAAILQIGDLLQSLGQHKEAETAYQRAVDMFSELAKSGPSPHGTRDLMVALTRLGWQRLQTRDDPATARPCLEQALALSEQLSAGRPEGDEQARHDRWTTLLACADLKLELGDRSALTLYQTASSLVPEGGSDAALTLRRWGAAALRLSKGEADNTQAEALLRRAVQADRQVLGAPGQAAAPAELAASLSHLARALLARHELAEARSAIVESIALAEASANQNPDSEPIQLALASASIVAGEVLDAAGDRSAAATHYGRALRILETVSGRHPLLPKERHLLQTAKASLAGREPTTDPSTSTSRPEGG